MPAVQIIELGTQFQAGSSPVAPRGSRHAVRAAGARRSALGGITFDIAHGECVAILGQNGSGKLTLV